MNLIPALVDIGLEEQTAANILAMSLIIAGGGRLIGGLLGDMLGTRRVLVVTFLAQAIAVTILAFASTLADALVFAVIFGVAFGARGTLMAVMRGDVFGRTNFSRLSGLMDPLSMLGVVISPIFAAFIYDTKDSYRIAFLAIAAVVSSGPHHQDSGEAKIRESTAGVSRKPSSDCKACGCSSKHLCGLTAWNT